MNDPIAIPIYVAIASYLICIPFNTLSMGVLAVKRDLGIETRSQVDDD